MESELDMVIELNNVEADVRDRLEQENAGLRSLVGELVAACEKFSNAHSTGGLGDDALVDYQDWAEFDQAVTKAKEAVGG